MAEGARAYLNSQLNTWGLGDYKANNGSSLSDWAWERYLETGDADIVLLELREQRGFKERFPAYEQLAKEGRALTPDQYVSYEQTYMALLQQYGVPDGIFDDRDHVARLLVNNVSATEVSERLAINADAMYTAPQEVRDALADMYGVGPNGMLAFYLDPDEALPKLQQQYVAAQIRGAVVERDFMLEREEAERYAAMGYTYQQAREASEVAAGIRGLTAEGVSERQLLGAQMGDVSSQRAVLRAAAGRRSRFSGGGRAVSENEGVTGLGQSSSQ
jgi:hypothetical protein